VQTFLRTRRAERLPGKVVSYEESPAPAGSPAAGFLAILEYTDPAGARRRTRAPVGLKKPCAEGAEVTLLRDRMTPGAVWIAPPFLSVWWLPLLLAVAAAAFLAGALGAAFWGGPG
jgi:hypothetical protein